MIKEQRGIGAYLVNLALLAVLTLPKALPYAWRIPVIGWLTARVVAPIAGYDTRIRENLALVRPDLDPAEIDRLCHAVADNAGRVFAEIFSPRAFLNRIARTPLTGPGLPALDAARRAGRPIIAVSGHFGNYDAPRAALAQAGFRVGGLYRPMANVYFNRHYVRMIETVAAPLFPQSRRGMAGMLKHLRAGNMVALVTDQRDRDGAPLQFFGRRVMTPLSAAEMALKYDALLIPGYGIRKDNGLDFEIVMEEPIPHSDPETMMQAVNDSLEARVRANMDQWLWVHRRWLPPPPRT